MQLCVQDEQPPLSAVEFHACSTLDPVLMEKRFSTAILDCGGWVLEQSATPDGYVRFLVEFGCERSMDVYSALVGLGIELSRHAHLSLTRLWQCARHGHCLRRMPVARMRITILSVAVAESELAETAPQGG
ncbi:MAG TPA: hypothetical protein VG267_00435 [Terracidiphilus sp.]|jgi:hypothetical protein|nr:hypothetical protein [Terracidiphilus sp.]